MLVAKIAGVIAVVLGAFFWNHRLLRRMRHLLRGRNDAQSAIRAKAERAVASRSPVLRILRCPSRGKKEPVFDI